MVDSLVPPTFRLQVFAGRKKHTLKLLNVETFANNVEANKYIGRVELANPYENISIEFTNEARKALQHWRKENGT